MQINPVNNYNNFKRFTFTSKIVNGKEYPDNVYLDACTHKHLKSVNAMDFVSRYGFFEFVFTKRADRYANQVNQCMEDLKVEEKIVKEQEDLKWASSQDADEKQTEENISSED